MIIKSTLWHRKPFEYLETHTQLLPSTFNKYSYLFSIQLTSKQRAAATETQVSALNLWNVCSIQCKLYTYAYTSA